MANRKVKKTRKSPARSRYEDSHPTVSFRLPKELHEQLMQHLATRDITSADFVKEALGAKEIPTPNMCKIKEAEYRQGYFEGFEDGYEWAESGDDYPTNLMTRRARDKAIEFYKKTMRNRGIKAE